MSEVKQHVTSPEVGHPDLSKVRKNRIERMEGFLSMVSQKLAGISPRHPRFSDYAYHAQELPKEIEIQKAYMELEASSR